MTLYKSISISLFAALLPALAHAEAAPCSLGQYAPVRAEAHKVQYVSDYGDFSVLQGAQLYVPAQPGLTREWLQHEVSHALASSACQVPAQHVQVDVVSAGAGFWVLLTGGDEREGEALTRWAASLVPQLPAAS